MSDKIRVMILIILSGFFAPVQRPVHAQSHEATQLLLNYEKLVQLRQILDDMRKGYTILNNGYNRVKDIAEGNFRLHEVFLNELLSVSPEVKKYYRISEIIGYQQRVLREYGIVYGQVKDDGVFTAEELTRLYGVYTGLFRRSLRDLEELGLILTGGELRMSDFERLEAIDRLSVGMSSILLEVRNLNASVQSLSVKRRKMGQELKSMKFIHGINP